MSVSHDGDRVVRLGPEAGIHPYASATGNSYLLGLIDDLDSGDLERVKRAQLQWQPGSYHCSIPEIDRMVDLSLGVEGVLGAQLAGAGLGGCMMLLVHEQAVARVSEVLEQQYFRREGKPVSILRCRPVGGSSVLFTSRTG
jgi:mevalonate kinase